MWRQQNAPAPMDESERSEIPLICFTVFTPAAVGASLFALPLGGGPAIAAVAVLMVTAGMLASIAHLARPLRAPRSLAHLSSSWLSREILAVSVFWALAALWLAGELGAAGVLPSVVGGVGMRAAACGFQGAAVAAGVVLLWVIAKAYRVHGQPAWDGSDTFWELVAGALGSGGAVAAAVAACQEVVQGGPLCSGSIFGCCSPLAFCLVSLLAISASCLIMGFAHRRRYDRVAALAEEEGGPRARAAWDDLAENSAEPRAYLVFDALAGACALVASAVALLFGGGAPWNTIIAAMLFAAAVCELAAQTSIRNRFYSLAQHLRYAVRLRR